MTPQVEVRNLSKAYTILHDVPAYGVLRDQLSSLLRHPVRTLRGHKHELEQIWALRDLNFDLQQGEVLGVVGRNGSGKSTLLKILSRIVAPTTGHAVMRGKVASLLEVGTGFHAELSGRENVYLNGAILGLSRRDIDRRFDEIVAFSEVERFLDTPVKFYSSGMYVRLAFAVAAHLEPDILIVDEVLAVGDAAFQRKSLGKMSAVAGEGRTVLFVSHNADSVLTLCTRGIHLSQGRVMAEGTALEALESYRAELDAVEEAEAALRRAGGPAPGATITDVRVEDDSGSTPRLHQPHEPLVFELDADVEPEYRDRALTASFDVETESGMRVFTLVSSWAGAEISAPGGHVRVRCEVPSPPLVSGRYFLSATLRAGDEMLHHFAHARTFEIAPAGDFLDPPRDSSHGPVAVDFKFHVGAPHRREVGGRAG